MAEFSEESAAKSVPSTTVLHFDDFDHKNPSAKILQFRSHIFDPRAPKGRQIVAQSCQHEPFGGQTVHPLAPRWPQQCPLGRTLGPQMAPKGPLGAHLGQPGPNWARPNASRWVLPQDAWGAIRQGADRGRSCWMVKWLVEASISTPPPPPPPGKGAAIGGAIAPPAGAPQLGQN